MAGLEVSRRQVLAGLSAAGVSVGTLSRAVRSTSAQAGGSTLTIALGASPAELDPHSLFEEYSALPAQGIYEGLIQLKGDATDAYEPLLAESWSANAELSVWTFTLRDGVTFSDGTPVDAAAVKASFDRMLGMGAGPSYTFNRFVTDAAQVQAADARTVVFDLGRPQPAFEAMMASSYGVKVANAARAMAEEVDGDFGHGWAMFNADGMGTGPYTLAEFAVEEQVVLERNPTYWREWTAGQFERIVIRIVPEIESRRQLVTVGDVDIVHNLTAEADRALASDPAVRVVESGTTGVSYAMMAVTGPLATPAARRAMCWAFPYAEVIDGVYLGRAGQPSGAVAETLNGFDPGVFRYTTDLDKARALLAEAEVPEGTTLSVMIEEGDGEAGSIAALFQANLAELGLTLDIQTVTGATLTDTIFRDASAEEQPSFLIYGWWPSYNDAWDHLNSMVTCGSAGSAGANAGYYCNAEVDAAMASALEAPTEEAYLAALAEVQRIVSEEDPPAVYFRQIVYSTVLRSDVQGFVFNPINIGTYDLWSLRRG